MVSYNSIQFWHFLDRDSTGWGLSPTRLPPAPPLDTESQVQVITCTYHRLAIKQRFQGQDASSVLINLLEQLTELRKTFYLLDDWLITKECSSRTARWKRCTGQGIWEEMGHFHALSRHTALPEFPRVHQPRSFPNSIPLGFLDTSLHRHGWLNHWWWQLIQPPAPPTSPGVAGKTESSNPLVTWLVSLATGPHP